MKASLRAVLLAVAVAAVPAFSACSAGSPPAPAPPPAKHSEAMRLFTHCGIKQADFDGRRWAAIDPHPAPPDLPNAQGVVAVDGYTAGTMTLISPDLAEFVVDDPGAAPDPVPFDFRPAPQPVQACA